MIIEALISPSFFSIKVPEAFQVADTYVLPPPSTIAGAFAYSYAIWKNIDFQEALRVFADFSNWYFVKPLSEIMISSIILRRVRILQAAYGAVDIKKEVKKLSEIQPNAVEVLDKAGLLRKKAPRRSELLRVLRDAGLDYYYSYYEEKMFDALFRRYAFTPKLYIAAFLPNLNERFPLSFTRLGDTESYVTVNRVEYIEDFETIDEKEAELDSYAVLSYRDKKILTLISGDVFIQKMTMHTFLLNRRSLRENLAVIVQPLKKLIKKERKSNDKGTTNINKNG